MEHVRTLADQEALKTGFYFDPHEADRAVAFFKRYLSIKGKAFDPLPWQEQIIRDLHGWKNERGFFRFRTAYCSCGRKNGKTELNSGLALLHCLGKFEVRPLVACAASTREQAAQIFDTVSYYVKQNRQLRDCLHLVPSKNLIVYPKEDGKIKVLSNESTGALGHGYSFISLDEVCFWPNDRLYLSLKDSSDARDNGIQCAISTSGYKQDDGNPGYRLYKYAQTILDGSNLDPTFYAAIWTTPEGADLDDPATWKLANPGLGVTQSVELFRQKWEAATKNSADKLDFLRKKFNIWTRQKDQFLDLQDWDSCKGDFPALDKSQVWFCGLDLSSTFDLTSCSLVSAPIGNKHYVRNWNWTTEVACQEREARNLQRYDVFAHEGALTIFPGNGIEYAKIRAFLNDLRNTYNIGGIVIEKWNYLALAQDLEKDEFQIYPFPPSIGYYNAPTKQLELLVRERRLVHDGNSLLRWAVQNTSLEVDSNGNCKPKRQHEAEKIDHLISMVLGLSAAMQSDKLYQPTSCVYDSRGIFAI